MSGLPGDVRRDLPLAVVASATTWLTMLSWRGFSEVWGAFLGPLLVVAIVIPLLGAFLRAAPVPRRAGALLEVLAVAVLVWLMLGGSLWHPVGSTEHLAQHVSDAWVSAETFSPPIPNTVPSIAPLLIPCGALSLLVVDLLACWLRRVSLAGLPLLAVYCVPVSVIGSGVAWMVFLLGAAGFLLMMFLQESAHVTRWGRPLGDAGSDPHGFGVSTGASRTTATTVGSVAVVLAVVLPLFIPTLHLDGLGLFGPGGSGGGGVKVTNPITDMRRNLHRGRNVPLIDFRTDDPDPSYLRIAVLTQFNGVEWTTGNRAIISNQTADGLLSTPEQGLSASVPTRSYNYHATATRLFVSKWLPTMFPVSAVTAPGAWHYDATTMDFISADNTTTAGLSWDMTAAKPDLSAYSMVHSLTAPPALQQTYTNLPTSLPPSVGRLAERVTASAQSRFEKARLLQQWFRVSGGFRYSLKAAPGDGTQALLTFLSRGNGGRVGYCEQFASAFAVMARTLDIPARVAVGFLQPTRTGPSTWQYRAHDLHAWPELYFQGSGWVRFEPTPATRAGAVPSYTTGPVRKIRAGNANQTQGGKVATDTSSPTARPHQRDSTASRPSSGTSVPWAAILGTVFVVVILLGLAMVPRATRRRRRAIRLAGGAEAAWAELRDSAVDLGATWPVARSPHETGHSLAGWFGAEPHGPPLIRPPRGRGLDPVAEQALDRIVHAVERVRYARRAEDPPGALAADVETCIAALEHGASPGALRRAEWWPRSLFVDPRREVAASRRDREPEAVAAGGVVDHVG